MGSLKIEDNDKVNEKISISRREFEISERNDKSDSETGNDITNNGEDDTKDDDNECVIS